MGKNGEVGTNGEKWGKVEKSGGEKWGKVEKNSEKWLIVGKSG